MGTREDSVCCVVFAGDGGVCAILYVVPGIITDKYGSSLLQPEIIEELRVVSTAAGGNYVWYGGRENGLRTGTGRL